MPVFSSSPRRGKRRSSQKYKAYDERFRALIQESADVFGILTPQGEMQEICPSWQAFTGQDQSQYLGRGWLDAFYSADQLQIEALLLRTIISGQAEEMECHLLQSDDTYHAVRIRAIPVHTRNHAIREVLLCGNEVIRQKPNVQMNETQMQFALKVSGVGIWDWDLISDEIVWTDEKKALFGFPPATPINYQRFLTSVHPDDREPIKLFRTRMLSKPPYATQEWYTRALNERPKNYRTIWPDGSIHWLENRTQMIYDTQGKPIHVLGATIDITDFKQAEEALRQSQGELRLLTETMPQFVWISQPDGSSEYMNQQLSSYSDMTLEQIQGDQWLNMVHPDDRERTRKNWYTALQTGQAYEMENRLREDKTGEYQWFLVRATPLIDEQGHILKWFGTCTNIHQQKLAEEALRESEIRFRALMDSNIIGINVADLQGTIREANDAYLSLVGYTREDLAAGLIHWPAMTPPEYIAQSMQSLKELLTYGVMQPFEKEYRRKDGRCVPVLLGSTLLHQRETKPLLLTFVLDLTARKELERQKDLMLGMTSHELKTPLAALKGTFQLMERRVKRLISQQDNVPTEISTFFTYLLERLKACVHQVDVQTYLINDLLDVSRITSKTLKLELDACDLLPIVRETVEELRVLEPERTLLLDLPEHTVVKVLADRNRIGQVVVNYVTNALRYASPDQPIQIGLTVQEHVARVWVRDKGPGLTKEAQNELWQRFHQVTGVPVQSGSGKGLGLGLYICQNLIAQHQGEVGVESTLGKGSTFWFTLPIVH